MLWQWAEMSERQRTGQAQGLLPLPVPCQEVQRDLEDRGEVGQRREHGHRTDRTVEWHYHIGRAQAQKENYQHVRRQGPDQPGRNRNRETLYLFCL